MLGLRCEHSVAAWPNWRIRHVDESGIGQMANFPLFDQSDVQTTRQRDGFRQHKARAFDPVQICVDLVVRGVRKICFFEDRMFEYTPGKISVGEIRVSEESPRRRRPVDANKL